MGVFKYQKDIRPIFLITIFFASDILMCVFIDNVYLLIAWGVLGILPKALISAWNHHHQHNNVFKSGILNRMLEVMYTFQTGFAPYWWVLHHNYGHHLNYLDQEKDESRWTKKNGEEYSALVYTLVTTVTSYGRAFQVGLKMKKILMYFLIMLAIILAIFTFAIYFRFIPVLVVIILPMIVALFITSYVTYDHHSGLDVTDVYKASRNITNNVYNKLTGNLGYHTAHHLRFGVHWSLLPKVHSEIEHLIPAECYMEPSFWFLVFDKNRDKKTS